MNPLGMLIWKWLALNVIARPSRPIFGLRGQTNNGTSGEGGNPKDKQKQLKLKL